MNGVSQTEAQPACLQCGIEDRRRLLLPAFFRKHPRGMVVDVLVDGADEAPDGEQRALQVERRHRRLDTARRLRREPAQRLLLAGASPAGNAAFEVLRGQMERAMEGVAEVVGQVAVIALRHARAAEVGILPERDLAEEEVTQRVDRNGSRRQPAELLQGRYFLPEVDHVPQRLRDLDAVVRPEPVPEHLSRRLEARRHQHRRPQRAVEADVDVLSHQVQVGGPPFRQAGRVVRITGHREVVDQRVEPDIDDLRRVAGDRDAPVDLSAGARDADVAQPGVDELQDLVAAELRL